MHTHADTSFGQADYVVSFDAFKVTRHGGARATRWEVHALASSPWARSMLARPEMIGLVTNNAGWPISNPGPADGFLHAEDTPFVLGVGFERKRDALDFVRDVEKMAERWSA